MLFYSILFYAILFYSILFYSILFYSILFYSILFYSILFYSIPLCHVKKNDAAIMGAGKKDRNLSKERQERGHEGTKSKRPEW